jgi:hypothetical protein
MLVLTGDTCRDMQYSPSEHSASHTTDNNLTSDSKVGSPSSFVKALVYLADDYARTGFTRVWVYLNYTDLQVKGVRCWYTPENMKIGDKMMRPSWRHPKHGQLIFVTTPHGYKPGASGMTRLSRPTAFNPSSKILTEPLWSRSRTRPH